MAEILDDATLWFDPRDEGDIARALTLFSQIGAQRRREMVCRW